MKDKFEKLIAEYPISAREYMYILRLAVYHIDGVATDSSYEVMSYVKGTPNKEKIYGVACEILKAINKKGK